MKSCSLKALDEELEPDTTSFSIKEECEFSYEDAGTVSHVEGSAT